MHATQNSTMTSAYDIKLLVDLLFVVDMQLMSLDIDVTMVTFQWQMHNSQLLVIAISYSQLLLCIVK